MKSYLLLSLTLAVSAAPLPAGEPPPVTVAESGEDIVMENGLIRLTLAKRRGYLTSIRARHGGHDVELGNGKTALYCDANGGPVSVPPERERQRPRAGYVQPVASAECQILRRGPAAVEVALTGQPSFWFPFRTEVHYVLPRAENGFYVYAVYHHGPGLPAAGLGQTRFVLKGVPGTRVFTHHVVDDRRRGPFPTARVVATVQDATFRLEDGTVYTKYDNTAYLADHHVHGMAGHGLGLWMVFPSNEFIGGGPVK
jgi:rhamnogalacturonan endolyase